MYPILCEDGNVYYGLTLVTFGEGVRKARPLCRLLNAVLPAGSVLTFLTGAAFLFRQNSDRVPVDNCNILLYYAVVVASLIMHEAAHLIAAVAFGYPVSEAGVIFSLKILPACLYIGHGRKKNATKGEEIQLALAGIACIALFRLILFTNEKYILWVGFIIFSPMVFMMLYCNA